MKKTIIVLSFLASSCTYQNNLGDEDVQSKESTSEPTNNQLPPQNDDQAKDPCLYVEEKSIEADGKKYTVQFLINCNSGYIEKGRPPENNLVQEQSIINQ